jgi:hypothetical protein
MAYNVAFAAHANCARALTEALMRGDEDTETLVEAESTARRQKEEARKKLHAALARALGAPHQPPTKNLLR